MKNLLILGAAVLGLCTLGQTARAGDDGPVYNDDRPAPRYHETYACPPRVYLPPPPPVVFLPPLPFVSFYGGPRFHRHYGPYGYGYGYRHGYGYRPGVHIGVGF